VRPRGASSWFWWLPPIYLTLLALHAPLLRLPYYWDEAGYFVPAALDILRHGWWVPHSTLPNGHPPLVMAFLALAWHVFGFSPLVTRSAMLAFEAVFIWGVFRLGEELYGWRAGMAAALLLGLHPLVEAQGSLAQLDLAAATWIVWALVWRWRGHLGIYALLAAAACLTKETVLVLPAALTVWDIWRWRAWRPLVPRLAAHLAPALALLAWLAFYHHHTGYWMGNAGFLSYNVGTVRSLPRILLSLLRRIWQLVGYDGMVLVSGAVFVAWWRNARGTRGGDAPHRERAQELTLLIAVSLVFHALLGGAVLARYLLSALAFFFVLLAPALERLPRSVLAACVLLLVANWFWRAPYPYPYEDNLAYATFVRLQQQGVAAAAMGAGPVATVWPATNELTTPDLGFVRQPMAVLPIEDFTPTRFSVPVGAGSLLLYSREYRPARDLSIWVPAWPRLIGRYFAYEPPLSEAAMVRRSGGIVIGRWAQEGQWVTLVRLAKPR